MTRRRVVVKEQRSLSPNKRLYSRPPNLLDGIFCLVQKGPNLRFFMNMNCGCLSGKFIMPRNVLENFSNSALSSFLPYLGVSKTSYLSNDVMVLYSETSIKRTPSGPFQVSA